MSFRVETVPLNSRPVDHLWNAQFPVVLRNSVSFADAFAEVHVRLPRHESLRQRDETPLCRMCVGWSGNSGGDTSVCAVSLELIREQSLGCLPCTDRSGRVCSTAQGYFCCPSWQNESKTRPERENRAGERERERDGVIQTLVERECKEAKYEGLIINGGDGGLMFFITFVSVTAKIHCIDKHKN